MSEIVSLCVLFIVHSISHVRIVIKTSLYYRGFEGSVLDSVGPINFENPPILEDK